MACRDCIWYSRCVLERRGICTDFKEKRGQSDTHKHEVGGDPNERHERRSNRWRGSRT